MDNNKREWYQDIVEKNEEDIINLLDTDFGWNTENLKAGEKILIENVITICVQKFSSRREQFSSDAKV